ncbi:MAG: HlyD family efflux transporter periplasmic adaptor subunit [Chthoniobacteraceae bacterium]
MSQEQAIDAARTRIQRLVEEIAALSKRDLPTEQFLPEFIARVVKATDARGGAVWLVGQRDAEGQAEFQLAAQIEFESCGFQSDEVQRALILRALGECVSQKKPVAMQPAPQQSEAGSLEAQLAQLRGEAQPQGPQNKTPFPFLYVPLPLKEQVLGVVQVWLQPYVTAENYREFATFLGQLAGYVEQHFQSRRLGTLVLETQRLQHLLKYTSDLAGSLDPTEVARLAANYGRDLIGCERCSVLWLDGQQWRVHSISGQEVVEKKSTMVKALAAFVGAHVKPEVVTLSKKELLAAHASDGAEGAEPTPSRSGTDVIDLAYFDVSHVSSAAIAPLLDDDKQIFGAYFAESTTEGFFDSPEGAKELPLARRVTDWLATHTGKQLRAAQDYHSLPFLFATKRLRATRLAFAANKRRRSMMRLAMWGIPLLLVLIYPKQDVVEGNCVLMPEHHNAIVTEVPGRVDKVLVQEGSQLKAGDAVVVLDTRRFETELDGVRKDIARLEAEAERYRGAGDEAGAQVASLQAASSRENAKRLESDIAAGTLRSPITGVILTKDIEKRAGEFIQIGTVLAEVAALNGWEMKMDVDQRNIGKVEGRLDRGPVTMSYILYSQTAHTLTATLSSSRQISAAAEAREAEHVFVVTIDDVIIPKEIESSMRPGLTGRAKIDLGRKPLGWLWLTRIWSWLEMRLIG